MLVRSGTRTPDDAFVVDYCSIYTDGSKVGDRVASAIVIQRHHQKHTSARSDQHLSSFWQSMLFAGSGVNLLWNLRGHGQSVRSSHQTRSRPIFVFVFGAEDGLFGHFRLFSFSAENEFSFSAENEFSFSFYFSSSFQESHLRWAENVMFATEP